MTNTIYQLPLTFEQILTLVRQLPESEQAKLIQELSQNSKLEPRQSPTQALKNLIRQVEPVPSDFDPQQAKETYLQEKYH